MFMGTSSLRDKLNTRLENLIRSWVSLLEKIHSPPDFFQKYAALFKVLGIMTFGVLLGDLAALGVGKYFSGDKNKGGPSQSSEFRGAAKIIREKPYVAGRALFEPVLTQNLFCPGCPIPDSKALAFSRPKDCAKAKPAPSQLKIIGTIVLSDPQYSVATLTDGSEGTPLKVGDPFKSFGTIFEIRRNRVCLEQSDGLLVFIESPDETLKVGQNLPMGFGNENRLGGEGIQAVSETEVEIAKPFLMEKLSDPSVLMQAHAVPFKDASGAIKGFKILSIVPGSVYESMGFQPNDVIVGVNGEPMNSIARAQELYAAAGTAQEVNIEIERGGNRMTRTFKVK